MHNTSSVTESQQRCHKLDMVSINVIWYNKSYSESCQAWV